MSIEFDLYEGDSASRLNRLFALPGQAPVGHQKPARGLLAAIGAAAAGLSDWLETAAHRRENRELESYLAGSADLAELEWRMREFERRQASRFHPYT